MTAKREDAAWRVRVLTLYPEMFPGPLALALAGRALARGLWALETVDIRDFARDKHRTVDDAPFGGGAGMVMRPDVVDAAIASATTPDLGGPPIYLTPRGRPLTQARVAEFAQGPGAVILCGRFEGVDERVVAARGLDEVSLGDFVLSGGEPAAIALIDACVRLLPGVVGRRESLDDESFVGGLLEYPQYTRPRRWRGRRVPEVLLSGDHGHVAEWRQARAEEATRERRPDLWAAYAERASAQERADAGAARSGHAPETGRGDHKRRRPV